MPFTLLLVPLLLACPGVLPADPVPASDTRLRLDPRLLVQAAEVWAIASGEDNPIWPGWDVGETPLLFYYPGEQEVLINHPAPPAGFEPYAGPLSSLGWDIMVRNGETVFALDGQNTSVDVGGVQTLVVADTLSNLRSNLLMWAGAGSTSAEREEALNLSMLAADPYDQMAMILHEAFHVQQHRWGLNKSGNESALLTYPCLSVANNVGFALEAQALTEALTAADDEDVWLAALRWLAIRKHRHAELPRTAVAYEHGTEFNEGLAKYTEWRLTYAIEGRAPAPAMAWVRGFVGYEDMSFQREKLLASMRGFLTGEHVVNNDPYGTAPVRFRLYWSGMAIGGMLDVIYPEWKERMMQPGTTFTSLVEEALMPEPADLELVFAEVMEASGYDELVAQKTKLREEGQRAAHEKCEAILHGAGTLLTVDYSRRAGASVGFNFTPFGITRVDEMRTIYSQVPVGAMIGTGNVVRQTRAVPLLHDAKRGVACFRLEAEISAEDVAQALGVETLPQAPLADVAFELPGVTVDVRDAVVRANPGEIVVELH